MRKHAIAEGVRYGDLEVVHDVGHRAEPNGHRRRWYLVRCKCGREFDCSGERLRTQTRCRSCAYDMARLANVGDRFDRLTVESFDRTDPLRVMAVCRCDCGGIARVRVANLPKNATNNCGCDVRGGWTGVGDLSGTAIHRMRRNASVRGLEFAVTPEALWALFLREDRCCALTGLPLSISKTAEPMPNGASLDRIDSSRGYEIGNVQWVHKDANLMKMDLSETRLVELCRLVVARADRKHIDALLVDVVGDALSL